MSSGNQMYWIQRLQSGLGLPEDATPQQLRVWMQGLDLSPDKLLPFISEPSHLPYGRTSLLRSAEAEVVVLHLPAGRGTYIHDHGDSSGCAYLAEGTLINRMYRLDAYGYPRETCEHAVRSGQFYYAPRGQIHQLINPGSARAVSLHVYTPSMAGAKVYHPYEQVLDFVI